MAEPVFPSLSRAGMIMDKRTIILKVLQFYFSTPKSAMTTPVMFDLTVGFMEAVSRFGWGFESLLVNKVIGDLTQCLQSYFEDATTVTVTCDIVKLEDSRYNVKIDCSIIYGAISYRITSSATVDDIGRLVVISFE